MCAAVGLLSMIMHPSFKPVSFSSTDVKAILDQEVGSNVTRYMLLGQHLLAAYWLIVILDTTRGI